MKEEKPDKKEKKSKKEAKPPEEKIYSVPLGSARKGSSREKASKAVKVVKEFLESKAGLDEYSIDPELNSQLWSRGIGKPPRSLKIKVVKNEGEVTVSPVK
ncbi:MAG: 50S ribosomal protein L31e [Candidatus Altiarchaeota archaeon]